LFGPGGNGDAFKSSGYLSTQDAPGWLQEYGLDAYEYEAGNGLSAGAALLSAIGEKAREFGIKMSYHTPYFISLSGIDPEKRLKSIRYIRESIDAAHLLGADIIVVHSGSCSKISRAEAMALAKDTLYKTLESVDTKGIRIGLETMGKLGQLGTPQEVIELCSLDKSLAPVVDFGHLNARSIGEDFKSAKDFESVFDKIGDALGVDAAKYLHCHFSKIEYSAKGEVKHLTFKDDIYGPKYEHFIDAVSRLRLCPTVICESAGTQDEDALTMKKYYKEISYDKT
jgi:deoxyribonuclease-4